MTNNAELLSQAFLERQPEAAAALLQDFKPQQSAQFLVQVPQTVLLPILMAMNSWPAAKVLSELPVALTSELLAKLNPSKAEILMRLLPGDQRANILKQLPNDTAKTINLKLTYPLGTVGAWMDASTPYFSAQSSVSDCLDFIKRRQSHVDGIVVVVDEFRHLLGVIDLDKLLISDAKQPLADLINTELSPLPAKATLWEIKQHEGWSHFSTLPVADHQQHILGTLSHSVLIEGTKKSLRHQSNVQHFSIMSHVGRAFFVALTGLILVAWGFSERPYDKSREGAKHD